MMIYVIGTIVLLMIAAPIIAILPSPQQKKQMEKRQAAMAKGIRVELTHIDDPDADPKKYIGNTGLPLERRLAVAAYRIVRRKKVQLEASEVNTADSTWALNRRSESAVSSAVGQDDVISGWFCDQDQDLVFSPAAKIFLQEQLARLPRDVVRIEETKFNISLYWHEEGEVVEVNTFLSACSGFNLQA